MHNTIFLSVIDRALAVCILIACVLVLRTIFIKAPRRMLLLLWLPVALRLLSPMTAQSRFSLLPASLSQSLSAYFQAEETTSETPQTGNSQTGTQPGMNLSDDLQTNISQSGTQTSTNPSGDLQYPSNPVYVASSPKASDSKLPGQTAQPDAAKLPNNGTLSAAPKKTLFLKTASTVWFAGVLLLAAYVLFELLRLRRLTKIARVQEIDGIPVYFGEHIPAPFLCGLFTPRIYLPDGLAAEYLPSVLAHERMHKSGRDNLLKPLAFLITVIYWFHPLVWLSYILFCKDLELACDERVISTLDTDGRKEYSQTLLAISTMPRTVCGYPIAFGETDVARRIQHILSFRKPKKAFTVLCVLTCVTLTACFSTNPKDSGEPSASGKRTPISAVKPIVGNTDLFVFGTEGTDDSEGLPEGIHLEFDPDTKTKLTWMAPHGVAGSDDVVYIEFNNLLDRKGYDFYVNFYTPGTWSEAYTQLIYDAATSVREIDIFCTGYDYYGGLYRDLARDGLCQELNAYLETAGGKALYDTKDELVWKSLSVDGKIYGLDGNPAVSGIHSRTYYYVNQDIAQKYEIDCERLFQDTSYFFDSIFTVEEGERADKEFEPYLTGGVYDWPEDMLQIGDTPVALRVDSDGRYQAVNLYEDKRIRQEIIACHELVERGHKVNEYTQSQIEAGKYFIIQSVKPVECGNAMEFTRPPFIYMDGNSSAGTCIAEWSKNKEAAFELLCAVYTDRELSEMLAYGIEGIHYRVKGEEIIKTDVSYAGWFAASLLANRQLLRDYDFSFDISFMEENREALLISPLFGNPLDYRRIKKQLVEVRDCKDFRFPYGAAGSWVGQDIEQKYEEGLQKLRDAGMDEVLDEINQQLKERGLQ